MEQTPSFDDLWHIGDILAFDALYLPSSSVHDVLVNASREPFLHKKTTFEEKHQMRQSCRTPHHQEEL
jgi:hypothetical protein